MSLGIVGAVFAVRSENGGLSAVFIVFSLDRECTVIPLQQRGGRLPILGSDIDTGVVTICFFHDIFSLFRCQGLTVTVHQLPAEITHQLDMSFFGRVYCHLVHIKSRVGLCF